MPDGSCTYTHRVTDLLQATFQIPHASHDVFDVVYVGEPKMKGVEEFGFHRW